MSFFTPRARDVSQPGVLGKCNRPDTAKAIQPQYTQLIGHSRPGALPIVYSDVYNIGFLGVCPSSIANTCPAALQLTTMSAGTSSEHRGAIHCDIHVCRWNVCIRSTHESLARS